jgi:hypothetical protein
MIEGTITDNDGRPIAGGTVLALPEGGYPAEANTDGYFVIPGPDPTRGRVVTHLYAQDRSHNLAGAVELKPGGGPVNIILSPAMTFTGRVVNEQGQPLPGANVDPQFITDNFRAFFGYTYWRPTNDRGEFELDGLATGQNYKLCISAKGYESQTLELGILHKPGVVKYGDIVCRPSQKAIQPAITTDQVIVEDLALAMLVAIRDKDDAALKALASDRIKAWPDALPQFAMEMRERFAQMTGGPFNMKVTQSIVEGDIAAVKCDGPKELSGTYLALFFVRTDAGWKNFSLRNSPPSIALETQLRNAAKAIGVQLPASRQAN